MKYLAFLLLGILLAVFSDKIEEASGHNPLVQRLLPLLARLLILLGFIGGALTRLTLL